MAGVDTLISLLRCFSCCPPPFLSQETTKATTFARGSPPSPPGLTRAQRRRLLRLLQGGDQRLHLLHLVRPVGRQDRRLDGQPRRPSKRQGLQAHLLEDWSFGAPRLRWYGGMEHQHDRNSRRPCERFSTPATLWSWIQTASASGGASTRRPTRSCHCNR